MVPDVNKLNTIDSSSNKPEKWHNYCNIAPKQWPLSTVAVFISCITVDQGNFFAKTYTKIGTNLFKLLITFLYASKCCYTNYHLRNFRSKIITMKKHLNMQQTILPPKVKKIVIAIRYKRVVYRSKTSLTFEN